MNALFAKYAGKTVLAVGAHPDDLELGAGGTLALLSRAGVRVVMVVICVPSRIETRPQEARQAARELGCELRFVAEDRCRRVEDFKTYELVSIIDGLVKELDPALMLAHSEHNIHKDHLLANAACAAAQRLHFFDLLTFYPNSCHPVTAAFRPQAYVDVTETIEVKMRAIQLHAGQFACRGLTADHYRDTAREYGRLAGTAYAEGLEVVRFNLTTPVAASTPMSSLGARAAWEGAPSIN